MKQENPLYSDTLKNFPHGNGFTDAAIPHGDDSPFVGLNPFFSTFLDFNADFDSVADMDDGQVVLKELCFYRFNDCLGVHHVSKNSQFLIITCIWQNGIFRFSKNDFSDNVQKSFTEGKVKFTVIATSGNCGRL
jgi:hypothetical protein